MKKTILAVDLFAGAGGTSTGLIQAVADLGYDLQLTAINHWDVAIASHTLNHPGVNHLCTDLHSVNPLQVVPEGYLDLLVASPECTHHSNARGGKPMDEQSRAGAEFVTMWAEKLYIENILIENVKEFMTWGPLDKDRRPIQKLKGQLFLNFIERLKALDYTVDYRLINAANYGDATTRERLFIQARKNGKKISWPEISHSKDGQVGFLGKSKWRPAKDIIDWTIKGTSIFKRTRPLKENTMRRIMKGLEKFGGAPFLAEYHSATNGNERVRSLEVPLATQDTSNRFGLCEPFIISMEHSKSEGQVFSANKPLPTITSADAWALAEPYIVTLNHGNDDTRSYSIHKPMPTVTGIDAWGLVEPFLVKYNGTGGPLSVNQPLDTVTGKDRFGLVDPQKDGSHVIVDVLFRMLMPKELAAAMSFPPEYVFTGPRDAQVKQIGNAVAVRTAKALTKTLIS